MSKNLLKTSIYGVGYIGYGKYKRCDTNNKIIKPYQVWYAMMTRCYSKKYQISRPTYINCTVCEEWHNYQNFAEWYDNNYYKVNDEIMHLDKDLLVKGNKIYSPENCVFVPFYINELTTKRQNCRGSFPIGVTYFRGKFRAKYNIGIGQQITIGYYDTPEEAFLNYKKYKEDYIKDIAWKYKTYIPNKLFVALLKYEVDITD